MDDKTITEIAREAQRKYQREWRAKNKDKVAAINRRYWEKKAAAIIEQQKGQNDESND